MEFLRNMSEFSNLAKVVLARTYARPVGNRIENWPEIVERVIGGNVKGHKVSEKEIERLRYFMLERKASPAGRGLWISGTSIQEKIGGAGMVNCWGLASDDWNNFVIAQDLFMLGGGVGFTVESKYVDKLPTVKKDVVITHKLTKDADLIVPDSREGWCRLLYRFLESWFVTGKGFTYSTICLRSAGEPIKGFGGVSSGPRPLVRMIEKLNAIFIPRQGKKLRPIDSADVICCIGEMVVSGNVRRGAILVQGDAWDREFLKAKRWDLGPIPTQRSNANFSVVASDAEHDLRPLFWQTYKQGEPFGIVNLPNIRKYGRMGEEKKDTATVVNPCAEACLEGGSGEPCNLQEVNLTAISDQKEFTEAARLMHRWGKRVSMENYHWPQIQEVITRNRRIGTGITGCLQRPDLFNPETLDFVYKQIQEENVAYSKELDIEQSIRTTVIKPSGSLSKAFDSPCEGIHPAYSKYFIQRVRIASNDSLISKLQAAGHHIEPQQRLDGSLDPDTSVVDFYVKTPEGVPCADSGFDTWKQLDAVKMGQRWWADQSISITAYYKDGDVPAVQEWVSNNLSEIKTISFLRHSGHGFVQAPKQTITEEEYEKLSAKVKPVEFDNIEESGTIEGTECESGSCPVR
jgi:Ribonucleotide reductase, barrel domain.